MARRVKVGLSYFPKDVDYYEDFKIIDLLNEYGPLGQTIYDVVISMVYREGYFLEFRDFEQLKKNLPVKIIRTIGNRWINKKNFVLQVILSCADIGLFDKNLLMQGVITSVGIQRRYDTVTVRNKVQKIKYRLIDENGQPLLNAPINTINVTEKSINVTETNINVVEMQQKKSKEKESKENKKGAYFGNQELDKAFNLYLMCRRNNNDEVKGEQIRLLIEQLHGLSTDVNEQIAIVNKATMSNWKSFYPLKKKPTITTGRPKNAKQFESRGYDHKDLTKKALESSMNKAKKIRGDN